MSDLRHPVNGRLLMHHDVSMARTIDICALCVLDKDCGHLFMRADPPCNPDSVLKYADPEVSP